MSDQTTAPADGRTRGWSEARRAAQDSRNGTGGERMSIPLVLPGRGQVGRLDIPAELDVSDWDIILGTLNAYRYAAQGPTT